MCLQHTVFTRIVYDPLIETRQFWSKTKHILVFSRVCSLAPAALRVTITLPHAIIGAVKRVWSATLLKSPDHRIMGNSADVEERKGAERGARERAQRRGL